MTVGAIEFHGWFARHIDRMLGRIPALDKAIRSRYPGVQHEIGQSWSDLARRYVQVDSGALKNAIGYRVTGVSPSLLKIGAFGVEYAWAVEAGFRRRELVGAHERQQSTVFGRILSDPRTVKVRRHLREQAKPARPFVFRAYFDSFRAMFGILNKAIGDARQEVGLE